MRIEPPPFASVAGELRRLRQLLLLLILHRATLCLPGELSYLLPLLAYLARPLAASPRAPERSAAELVAGETPVTFWSRAQARWTRRTTGILPSPSFRSVARCFAFAITRPKVVAAFSVAGDAPVVPDASHRHHRVRGAGPRP